MVDKIFEEDINNKDINTNKESNINEKLITLHLWNTYSEKYYKNIDWNYIFKYNTLYSKILKNLLINYVYKDINKDINLNIQDLKEEYIKNIDYTEKDISIIMIYEDIIKDQYILFFDIFFNNKYLHLIDIDLIIIDNGTNNFYNLIYKNNELKTKILEKGINLKIIELKDYIKDEILCKNIGIEHCKYKLIKEYLFDNSIINNNLTKCYNELLYLNYINNIYNI
jgi:hypothetical protein